MSTWTRARYITIHTNIHTYIFIWNVLGILPPRSTLPFSVKIRNQSSWIVMYLMIVKKVLAATSTLLTEESTLLRFAIHFTFLSPLLHFLGPSILFLYAAHVMAPTTLLLAPSIPLLSPLYFLRHPLEFLATSTMLAPSCVIHFSN